MHQQPAPPAPPAPSTRPSSWPWIVGASLLVTAVAALGVVGLADSDGPRKLAAGSRVGQADPFDTRHRADIQPVWSHSFLADPTAMVVDGADVYAAGPYSVTALSADSGEERWVAQVTNADPYLAVNRDAVAVGATDGFELLARADGTSRWRHPIEDPTDRARGVAIVGDGPDAVVISATDHGGLTGLDAATGAVRWTTAQPAPPRGPLVADAASMSVVASSGTETDTRIQVLDARTGTVRWSATLDRDTGIPAVVGASLLVVTGNGDAGALQAFALADGRSRWSRPLRSGAEATMGLVPVGPTVIGVDSFGTAFSVSVETGAVRWRTTLPGPVLADSPVVVDGLMVVHDSFAQIHTIDARTGRRLGSRESVGVPTSLGAATHRVVYAQSRVQYGQVIAYAPGLLRRPVGAE